MTFSIAVRKTPTRDYGIGANGRLNLSYDPDSTVDRLHTRLDTWLGDWYLDTSKGIDYKNKILGQSRNGSEISAILRREILSEPDVDRIDDFQLIQDTDDPRGFKVLAEVTFVDSAQTATVQL